MTKLVNVEVVSSWKCKFFKEENNRGHTMWGGFCPLLDVATQGVTRAEVEANMKEAIELHLAAYFTEIKESFLNWMIRFVRETREKVV